ncbi:MAG: hypothetical protein M1835_003255 [Candelina submexicana]|nr:MAG: hypothetical protein M1835_003255 [Candelina submexicana]
MVGSLRSRLGKLKDYNSSNAFIDHSFHLLIPASRTTPELCKTLISANILNYPPPILVNFGKDFNDADSNHTGSHTGKLRGVLDHLRDDRQIHDEDIVLVIDGYDVWFQLPPETMIERYYGLLNKANARLKKEYHVLAREAPVHNHSTQAFTFSQTVVYGADKACWPNPPEDPACADIPASTLPRKIYGLRTDKDSDDYLVRPRYLNSGTVIGPASDLKAIHKYAVDKVETENRGVIGDQFVLSEIFGEQEAQRRKTLNSRQTASAWFRWRGPRSDPSAASADATTTNNSSDPHQGHEFNIGLDYESALFQTMTHSHEDLEFIIYNSTTHHSPSQKPRTSPPHHHLQLPLDIQDSTPPLPSNITTTNPIHAFSPNLDILPNTLSWLNIPLATNLYASSIPTLLHFNGDKSYLNTWWPRMWYHPYGRALLRQHIRTPQRPIVVGDEVWWDRRGGKGGAWTDTGRWMDWGEVCGGFEESVFGDGLGRWGMEEGARKVYNGFGKLLIGVGDGG